MCAHETLKDKECREIIEPAASTVCLTLGGSPRGHILEKYLESSSNQIIVHLCIVTSVTLRLRDGQRLVVRPAQGLPHQRVLGARLGVSPRTGEREMARGNSPVITQLSARRVGVLGADANAYVRARRRVQSARALIDSNWKQVGAAAAAVVAKVGGR